MIPKELNKDDQVDDEDEDEEDVLDTLIQSK